MATPLMEIIDPAYLKAQLARLDTDLSTRASETTLSGIKTQTDKLTFDTSNYLYVNSAVVANPPNLDVALSTRLADSKIPSPLAQLSKDISGSTVDALAVVGSGSPMDITRQPTYDELSVTTTESSISYTAPGLKLAILVNRGDDDILIRINDSAGTQIKIPARCGKIIGFGGITAIYYVATTSSSTLIINGWS